MNMPTRCTRKDVWALRGKEWRKGIERAGIHLADSLPVVQHPNTIITTNCSGTKGINIPHGIPKQFYLGRPQLRLYEYAKRHRLEYAILSDMYGIHFADESLPLYDLGPTGLKDFQLWKLGETIGEKCRARGIYHLYYHCSSPTMAMPYIVMLSNSELNVAYATKHGGKK